MNYLLFTILTGIGATAVMDIWAILRKKCFGIALPNYRFVGRWIAHMRHGRFRHEAIAAAAPVQGEKLIGWISHYLIGIIFAALLLLITRGSWIHSPSIGPAVAVGVCTVAAPFFLMQPGMGAGIAASRTQQPNSARLQSLITHSIFGLGLFASGRVLNLLGA
jgi:hypothetical protein